MLRYRSPSGSESGVASGNFAAAIDAGPRQRFLDDPLITMKLFSRVVFTIGLTTTDSRYFSVLPRYTIFQRTHRLKQYFEVYRYIKQWKACRGRTNQIRRLGRGVGGGPGRVAGGGGGEGGGSTRALRVLASKTSKNCPAE